MIGILAKLAKAAHLAKKAEAAIDVASHRLGPRDEESEKPDLPTMVQDPAPAEYLAMVETGVPDARDLLPASDVERIISKRIRSSSLAATDDCLVCDYHCKDRAGTVLGLHISKTMPWEGFTKEIEKMEVFGDLGDEAFRGGRQIYVKAGGTVFWIHTAGEVMVDMAVRAARQVIAKLDKIAP